MYALYISYFVGQCLHLLVADDDAENTHTMNGNICTASTVLSDHFLFRWLLRPSILIRESAKYGAPEFAFMIG
jgi:hypothetical protein